MSTKLRPMHLGDLLIVLCNQSTEEMVQYEKLTGKPYHVDAVVVDLMTRPGEKWTLIDEALPDQPLAVGGLTPNTHATFSTWCYVHKDAWVTHAGPLTAQCRGVIERALHNGARRVDTLCLAGRPVVQKWYEKLGLHYEATLRMFGADGTDAVVHAATRESE